MRAHTDQTSPWWIPGGLVLLATLGFGAINISNASAFAPHWGQDLAFFEQLIHSAANGGPWASPLILEPQGFWDMVHTHLVLPLVVGIYALVPTTETLLVLNALFVSMALWPAFRLGEAVAGRRHALLCVLAIVAFGPSQAVATGDFRPVVLFIPGILGVLASAWTGRTREMLFWAGVALLGRQEASYLLASCGLALLVMPWGRAQRRQAWTLLGLGVLTLVGWAAMKEQMFFHVNPTAMEPWPTSGELWESRGVFGGRLALSGWSLGILAPTGLLAGLPVLWGMLGTQREWHLLFGPGVHHHAFWLPFVIASGIVACQRIPRNLGPLLLLVLGTFAFPWATPREGPSHLNALVERVPDDGRVAADYDTIHALGGRSVLWNVEQLYQTDRPYHWDGPWPLTLEHVDWLLMPVDHPVSTRAEGWEVEATAGRHVLLRRP